MAYFLWWSKLANKIYRKGIKRKKCKEYILNNMRQKEYILNNMHHKICENTVRSIFLKGIKPTIPPFLISPLTNPNPLNLTNISRTLLVQHQILLSWYQIHHSLFLILPSHPLQKRITSTMIIHSMFG